MRNAQHSAGPSAGTRGSGDKGTRGRGDGAQGGQALLLHPVRTFSLTSQQTKETQLHPACAASRYTAATGGGSLSGGKAGEAATWPCCWLTSALCVQRPRSTRVGPRNLHTHREEMQVCGEQHKRDTGQDSSQTEGVLNETRRQRRKCCLIGVKSAADHRPWAQRQRSRAGAPEGGAQASCRGGESPQSSPKHHALSARTHGGCFPRTARRGLKIGVSKVSGSCQKHGQLHGQLGGGMLCSAQNPQGNLVWTLPIRQWQVAKLTAKCAISTARSAGPAVVKEQTHGGRER